MIWKRVSSVLMLIFAVAGLSRSQTSYDVFSEINSTYDEQNPILSPDGQILYFTRAHHPENAGGSKDPGDIWYSKRLGDEWSEPVRAANLNSLDWNGVVGFNADGSTIYLHGHYTSSGRAKTQGIAKSQRNSTGWSDPQNITIPYFKNFSSWNGASITADESVLFLSIQSYGTVGNEDIYMCRNINGQWSEPKNMGKTINTEFQELTPNMFGDSLLFFATNGHTGMGSTDIFVSRRLDETWNNWSKPESAGQINTDGRELSFRQYEDFAIYTSTINSDGYGDIKLFVPAGGVIDSSKFKPVVARVELAEKTIEEIEPNTVVVYGSVMDASSNTSVNADLTVTETSDNKSVVKSKTNEGIYTANLQSPGEYTLKVHAKGYVTQQQELSIQSDMAQRVEINFVMQPISVGTRVKLEHVLFEQSKPTIVNSSFSELNLVVDLMKEYPNLKIRLEGHTDNRGNPKHNLKLSKERVNAVKAYLVERGIASKRISGKGFGGSNPIADNNDANLRRLNRRVEFVIVKE